MGDGAAHCELDTGEEPIEGNGGSSGEGGRRGRGKEEGSRKMKGKEKQKSLEMICEHSRAGLAPVALGPFDFHVQDKV